MSAIIRSVVKLCGSSRRDARLAMRGLHNIPTRIALSQNFQVDNVPSNLTFDRISSYAPKEALVMDPPSTDIVGDIDLELEEEKEFSFAEVDACRNVVPLPDRLKADIHHGLDGSVNGSIWLNPTVFGVDPIRVDLIKQSVDYIRNKIRGRRKVKTKTISEVSGSGRKVRQQKGTGRARAGHSRPAHWRGGAKAHGPKNIVDYADVKMNKKVKRLAMISALSQKLKEGNLVVIDDLCLESHKTSKWAQLLEDCYGIGKDGSSAFILDHYFEPDDEEVTETNSSHASYNGVPINLWVASSNMYYVKVANQRFANVLDILKQEKLVVTLSALEEIELRLKA